MTNADLPLVISCQGGTPPARLAGRVAVALDDLGVAEATQDLDEALAAVRDGRRLIALDGCSSGCRTRLLEAKGVPAQARVSLADLGVDAETAGDVDPTRLAAEIAVRLRSRSSVRRPTPRHRRRRPEQTNRAKRPHVVDDYLLAIDSLASTPADCGALTADAPTLAAHVSRLLGVSRASAGEMLARLETIGLVERGTHKELLLTSSGRAAADAAVRRHRLLECLLSDLLGYPPHECYERARVLDGSFDDDAIERLSRALADPERCPHGWPVDPQQAREESLDLAALHTLRQDERATVVRVAEHDDRLIADLYRLGLTPGTEVAAGRPRLRGDRIGVRVNGASTYLDAATAACVFVRPRP